jgi:hypothetical protein
VLKTGAAGGGASSLLCSTPPRTMRGTRVSVLGRERGRDREGEGGRLAANCLQPPVTERLTVRG